MTPRRILIVVLLLVVSLTVLFSVAYADSYSGTLTITCTDALDFGPGLINLSRDNTASGAENFEIIATDATGTVLRDFFNSLTLGDYVFGDLVFTTVPKFNPITVKFISLAGNSLPEVTVFSVQGSCAGLATVGACLPLDANSVVGDMPNATQADWAPGKQANGVVVNPGTYWVLGEDSSGQYYEIGLACQTIWVPLDSMQPSFQPPQNGQPLPTNVVS